MSTANYLSEQELNEVKGLMHYLNANMSPNQGTLVADVKLTDAAGQPAGGIEWNAADAGAGYVLRLAS